MKEHLPFVLQQIIRFGAISGQQLVQICSGTCSQATLYRDLKRLLKEGYIVRLTHPVRFQFGFAATERAIPLRYSSEYKRPREPRTQDLEHMLSVTGILMQLARYDFVSGLCTEFELDPSETRMFSLNRTPDGIIQVTRGESPYELAVEFELFQKDPERIHQILSTYETVLSGHYQCGGLLLVAQTMSTLTKYHEVLSEMPESFRKKVILRLASELESLNPKYFGHLHPLESNHVRMNLERVRNVSQGVVSYSSVNSTHLQNLNPQKDPQSRGQLR